MTARPPTRRSFLTTASAAMLAGGGVMAAIALGGAASQAPADVDAAVARLGLDDPRLTRGEPVRVRAGRVPILVFARSPAENALLMRIPPERVCVSEVERLQSPISDRPLRSLRADLGVFVPVCTYEGGCVVAWNGRPTDAEPWKGFVCPCCGSQFDLAGRRRSGPAMQDLLVPPHHVSGGELVVTRVPWRPDARTRPGDIRCLPRRT